MNIQKHLFDVIRGQIGSGLNTADVISDVLNVNIDAAYRRLRGITKLSIDEAAVLCKHFNVSVDHMLRMSANIAVFEYDLTDRDRLIDDYYVYIEKFSGKFVKLASAREKEILTLVHDIPLYHLMAYPELSFFKLYAWNYSVGGKRMTYEEFVRNTDTDKIARYHKKVAESMKQIPSTEIWSKETINPQVNLIEYYLDMGCFEDRETPLLLCRQLLSLVTEMEQWAEQGGRDFKGRSIPFRMYDCPLKVMPNFSVVREDGVTWGFMHLYGTKCMLTSSSMFCAEMDKLLRSILVKSLFVNGASLRERYQIFSMQRNKIETLLRKIGL